MYISLRSIAMDRTTMCAKTKEEKYSGQWLGHSVLVWKTASMSAVFLHNHAGSHWLYCFFSRTRYLAFSENMIRENHNTLFPSQKITITRLYCYVDW